MSDWQIIAGDCLEIMASIDEKSIDAMITDPPYSAHVHEKHRVNAKAGRRKTETKKAQISRSKDLGFASLSTELRIGIADQAARLVRRWVAVFCDVEGQKAWEYDLGIDPDDLEYVRTCAWVKLGAAPQFTGDRPGNGFECIVVAHPPGRKRWNGGGKQGVYTHAIELDRGAEKKRIHTTQKPLALMLEIVADFTEPGELIIDPCCGSGTTGEAAIRLGRRFLGIEADPAMAELARGRLSKVERDPVVFGAKARQKRLL